MALCLCLCGLLVARLPDRRRLPAACVPPPPRPAPCVFPAARRGSVLSSAPSRPLVGERDTAACARVRGPSAATAREGQHHVARRGDIASSPRRAAGGSVSSGRSSDARTQWPGMDSDPARGIDCGAQQHAHKHASMRSRRGEAPLQEDFRTHTRAKSVARTAPSAALLRIALAE